jgi:carboxypeptidase C (cathepsin A)
MTDSDYVEEMIQAIYSFYYKFPELRDQDLYLSGQQYAGITIPKMAKRIIEINNDRYIPVIQKIKLKGFLLENPCTMRD